MITTDEALKLRGLIDRVIRNTLELNSATLLKHDADLQLDRMIAKLQRNEDSKAAAESGMANPFPYGSKEHPAT